MDDLENQKFQCFKKKYLGSKNSWGFPDGSVVESACHVGDGGLIPGLERSSGEGNDNPLHYSCLGNHMARGAWQATVHGVTKSWTQLSDTTTTKRNAYNKVKKKWGDFFSIPSLRDNNVKNLCFGSFVGSHYIFVFVFLCL